MQTQTIIEITGKSDDEVHVRTLAGNGPTVGFDCFNGCVIKFGEVLRIDATYNRKWEFVVVEKAAHIDAIVEPGTDRTERVLIAGSLPEPTGFDESLSEFLEPFTELADD